MSTQKSIVIASVVCLIALGTAFFFSYNQKQNIQRETETHLRYLNSLSGKLTLEEKTNYFKTVEALEILQQKRRTLSKDERAKLAKHIWDLCGENPELVEGMHNWTDSEHQQKINDINEKLNALKEADYPLTIKKALIRALERRLDFLQDGPKRSYNKLKLFLQLRKSDPDLIGFKENHITGELTKLYPNMLTIRKRRIHHPDGTVKEMLVGSNVFVSDPNIERVVQEYLTALKQTALGETPPAPPKSDSLRFKVVYEDIYPDSPIINKSDGFSQNTQEVIKGTLDPSENHPREDKQFMPMMTAEEISAIRNELEKDGSSNFDEDFYQILEQATKMPVDQFLEMTDAEIEAELMKSFIPDDPEIEAELERQIFPEKIQQSELQSLENTLRKKFSQERLNHAMQVLNRYGPQAGVHHLKESDPEVAGEIKEHFQKRRGN